MALPQTGNQAPDIKKPLSHNVEQVLPETSGEALKSSAGPETVRAVTGGEIIERGFASSEDSERLNTIRSGTLSTLAVPVEPVDETTLADIKKHLFPTIDFEKTNPTPQELINYLLLNHSMKLEQAHDWIEFLASNGSGSL